MIVRYPLVLGYCIGLHFVWAAMLVVDSTAGNITAMHDLYAFLGALPLAAILMTVAILALWPIFFPQQGLTPMLLMIPQQIVITIAAGTALSAMVNSAFADGVVRPRAFIIADQAPAVLAAIFHTAALIGNYWGGHLYKGRKITTS